MRRIYDSKLIHIDKDKDGLWFSFKSTGPISQITSLHVDWYESKKIARKLKHHKWDKTSAK